MQSTLDGMLTQSMHVPLVHTLNGSVHFYLGQHDKKCVWPSYQVIIPM